MKRAFPVAVLTIVILTCGLEATAQANHLTINAVDFNYIAGTPDYTQGAGLVAGGSSTAADGIANVALPQGAVVAAFRLCGRDFASDQNITATLWRKSINPVNSTFMPPFKMAHVQTGVAQAVDAMKCLKTTTIVGPTVDNTLWTYFAEVTIGFTTEVISVTVDY